MAITSPLEAPPIICLNQVVMPEHGQLLHPPQPLPPADPDKVQAVEAVFAAKEKESQEVASLLGLWTSVAMLNDLVIDAHADHMARRDREELEPEPKPAPKPKKHI